MNEKIPCSKCGGSILQSTSDRTGGLCMPCKNGYRKNIEQAKEYYKKERQLDKNCPFRALWRELVHKVYKQDGGFDALSEEEKIYFSVNTFIGDVYNGGFIQYFDNTASGNYHYAELGLIRLDATHTVQLLRQAKEKIFGSEKLPLEQAKRWKVIEKYSEQSDLSALDTEFDQDKDNLDEKLERFAINFRLVKNV